MTYSVGVVEIIRQSERLKATQEADHAQIFRCMLAENIIFANVIIHIHRRAGQGRWAMWITETRGLLMFQANCYACGFLILQPGTTLELVSESRLKENMHTQSFALILNNDMSIQMNCFMLMGITDMAGTSNSGIMLFGSFSADIIILVQQYRLVMHVQLYSP